MNYFVVKQSLFTTFGDIIAITFLGKNGSLTLVCIILSDELKEIENEIKNKRILPIKKQ
jgi:hypothetical protein